MAKDPVDLYDVPALPEQFARIEKLADSPELTPDEKRKALDWVAKARVNPGVSKKHAFMMITRMGTMISERRGPPQYPCVKCGNFKYPKPDTVCFWCRQEERSGDQKRD